MVKNAIILIYILQSIIYIVSELVQNEFETPAVQTI